MKGNNVAKNMHKANKAKVFVDRKKEGKRGKNVKHKNKDLDNLD